MSVQRKRSNTETLCRAVYGRDCHAREIIGNADAKFLLDAALLVRKLNKKVVKLERENSALRYEVNQLKKANDWLAKKRADLRELLCRLGAVARSVADS